MSRSTANLMSKLEIGTNTLMPASSTWDIFPRMVLQPKPLTFLIGAYLLLVQVLRYRRSRQVQSQFPDRASLAKMTFQQAETIQSRIVQLECPFWFEKAFQMATFRTFGIPSISKVLLGTRRFSAPEYAPKRYADTSVLISEFVTAKWGDQRWQESISRINCVHHEYQKAGKILNDDMLYTLAMFAGEPYKWIERYDWRDLSMQEKAALGVYWKGIGEAMNIEYKGLPGHDSGAGWRDGLEWLEQLMDWSASYAERTMVPDDNSAELGVATIRTFLMWLPEWSRLFGTQVFSALMDDRLRAAMKIPPPPVWIVYAIQIFFAVRAVIIQYLCLPRFVPLLYISDKPSEQGTFFLTKYEGYPYYVKPTFWNRWGLPGLYRRYMGIPVPGDDGNRYFPSGYYIKDVGPPIGKKHYPEMLEKVSKTGSRRCPFHIAT